MSARRGGSAPTSATRLRLRPIGTIRSELTDRRRAPKQGSEGAPDAWLEVQPWASKGLRGVAAGDEVLVITWLHEGRRDVLQVHPRGDGRRRLTGVFATRSPDRPNPLGLHPVTVREIVGNRLRIGPIEAIEGTPVVDVKPALARSGVRACPPAISPDAAAEADSSVDRPPSPTRTPPRTLRPRPKLR
jgi:tRNA-Thr(GGU) m(6)t(6)A37 methyltransferase TsaA